jgi:pimeloyl-ACP methyl ester carboxylesterase
VLPSLPGYGFSGKPTELGWDASRTARAWAELMHRLGYTRYVAQGGDVGALVTDLMGRQAVKGLVGYHLNLLTAVLAIGDQLPKESEQERAAAEALAAALPCMLSSRVTGPPSTFPCQEKLRGRIGQLALVLSLRSETPTRKH